MASVNKLEQSDRCFHCGNPASAFWDGPGGRVRVCLHCAVQVLPALSADAVVAALGCGCSFDWLKGYVETMQTSFWRAAVCALLRRAGPPAPWNGQSVSENGRRN